MSERKRVQAGLALGNLAGRKTVLTAEEEVSRVELCKLRADPSHWIFEGNLQESVVTLVSQFTETRPKDLPFVNRRSGDKWVVSFLARHPDVHLGKASKNQEIRYRSCNTDALAADMASKKRIIDDYNIRPSHIANLDEAGCTPGIDGVSGMTSKTVLTRRGFRKERSQPESVNCGGATLVPVIFVDGRAGWPLIIFNGSFGVQVRTVQGATGKTR